jgi:hypothetical protein
MLNAAEKAYCLALEALKRKEYRRAADYFDQAEGFFAANEEFSLLRETTRLLVAVKEELGSPESGESDERIEIEEVEYGQENELR